MKKKVLIKVTDTQTTEDGSESVEITTHGYVMYGSGNMIAICYDECFDEEHTCHTRITVKNGLSVSVMRTGAYNSDLYIEHGKRQNCLYQTPYGEFMIGIFGREVSSEFSDGLGTLSMKYTVDYYGGLAAENEMTITVAADGGKDEEN